MQKSVVPPLSTRMYEPFSSKNEWLYNYFQFRRLVKDRVDISFLAKNFLSKIGRNNSDLAIRFRGCLLGLAIGDALGTTLEFSSRNISNSHTEIIGGGPFGLNPGEWTDDTSMALCLAQSLLEKQHFDPRHQMDLYVAWWKEGFLSSNGSCFDIGNTVSTALQHYIDTGEYYAGSNEEHSAGNGSLMRLAPVVLFYASDPDLAVANAALSSKTTHGNLQCVDSCRYFAALLIGALKGVPKHELLAPFYYPTANDWKYNPLCGEVSTVAQGSFKEKSRENIESTGYVIHTLEAALWAFYNSNSFEEGLVKAVNLGGDSDTVGAIYGQLAGAYYGDIEIPFKYLKDLKYFYYFYFFADEFLSYYSGQDEFLEFSHSI